eukprot:scaffold2068_cov96-Cylindrotheca_fusiformis.AAC.13
MEYPLEINLSCTNYFSKRSLFEQQTCCEVYARGVRAATKTTHTYSFDFGKKPVCSYLAHAVSSSGS